jgi:hypothetical protein
VWTSTPRSGAALIAGGCALLGLLVAVALTMATTMWVGIPCGAVIALAGIWLARHRQLQVESAWSDHRVLTRHEDQQAILRGVALAQHTLRLWPELQEAVAVDDPGSTLAQVLWEVSGWLVERASIRAVIEKLNEAARPLATDNPVYADLSRQLARAYDLEHQLNTEIATRLGNLSNLREQVGQFVSQRRAAAAARATLADTDRVLDAFSGVPAADPAGDLSSDLRERTSAILAAYRELTEHLPTD